jgi:hypothetical protein
MDMRSRSLFGLMAALGAIACGGTETSTPGAVTSLPARSGNVWEIQAPDERTAVSGSIVAFVNGVHVMVIDGDRIYAGMTELTAKGGPAGAQTISFPSGLSADMVRGGQGTELRFSSGERVTVRERP